jgi:hypothetical protein
MELSGTPMPSAIFPVCKTAQQHFLLAVFQRAPGFLIPESTLISWYGDSLGNPEALTKR